MWLSDQVRSQPVSWYVTFLLCSTDLSSFLLTYSMHNLPFFLPLQELVVNGLSQWCTSRCQGHSPASYASSLSVTTPGLAHRSGSGHGWAKLSHCHNHVLDNDQKLQVHVCTIVISVLLTSEPTCDLHHVHHMVCGACFLWRQRSYFCIIMKLQLHKFLLHTDTVYVNRKIKNVIGCHYFLFMWVILGRRVCFT